jgi:hypothetical protein
MSGLGAEWLRALVGKVSESDRRRRAWKRTWRRRLLTLQRALSWVATHELDEKPPTHLHKNLQDARRSDDRGFMQEILPLYGLQPPSGPNAAAS